jgi:hypothetical protein
MYKRNKLENAASAEKFAWFLSLFFFNNLENRKTYGKKIRVKNVYAQNISLSDNYIGSYSADARRHACRSLCVLSCVIEIKTATHWKSSRKPTKNKTNEIPLHLHFHERDEAERLIFATFLPNLTF